MTEATEKSLEQFGEIQAVAERTRTIQVMERVVAKDGSNYQEVSNPVNVFVRPLPFRRWFSAMNYLQAIFAALPQGNFDLADEAQLAMYIINLIGQVPDAITGLACLATDKEPDFFDRIDLDEGVKIMVAVVEVNKDFFVQKVLPMLSEIAPKVKDSVADTFGQTA